MIGPEFTLTLKYKEWWVSLRMQESMEALANICLSGNAVRNEVTTLCSLQGQIVSAAGISLVKLFNEIGPTDCFSFDDHDDFKGLLRHDGRGSIKSQGPYTLHERFRAKEVAQPKNPEFHFVESETVFQSRPLNVKKGDSPFVKIGSVEYKPSMVLKSYLSGIENKALPLEELRQLREAVNTAIYDLENGK